MRARSASGLMTEMERYIILILMCWLFGADCLTCIVNGKPKWYDPDNQLCCEGIYLRVQDGHEMRCCNGTTYASNSHQCCNGTVYKLSSRKICCGNQIHDNENQDLEPFPKESSTYRYECCDGVLHTMKHLDLDADYMMSCCGRHIYNTSQDVCCAGQLLNSGFQPRNCCNNREIYFTSSHICCGDQVTDKSKYLCATQTGSRKKLILKDDVDDDDICINERQRTVKTYNSKTHMCDNQVISHIKKGITKDGHKQPDVKPQSRIGPPKCPLCISGNYTGPLECRNKNQLNFVVNEMEKRKPGRRKPGRLLLHVLVTYPRAYAGRRMKLQTRRVCRTCFTKDVAYAIFTNRSLRSLSRITRSDVIVQEDQLASYTCTLDRWANTL